MAGSPNTALAAVIAAAILVVANVSSLNVALPELSRQLGASQTDVHWMVDVYAVFLAALLLPAGALGDRFGRRRILLFGLTVIVAANAAVLLMDAALPVIVARGASGVGAAFVFPATLSTITATMPADKRGRGVAIWTAAVNMGGIIGVLGSGVLIESFWWGSVFLAMALAATAVLALCWALVPDSADPDHANLDPVGAILSFVAVGAIVLGIVEGPAEGWTSPLSLAGILIGIGALTAFVVWELRTARPLLDVRVFSERGVRAGSLSLFIQFLAAFGFFFVAVFYLAFVRGFGPLKTGLGLLPAAIGLLPGTAIAIPLASRFGRRAVGAVGLLILASTFVVGLSLDVDSPFWQFGLVMAIFGLGLGLSAPPATDAIVEALPPAKQGVASALNDVLREFGAAIGIAVVGASFNSGYRNSFAGIDGLPAEAVEAVRESPAAAAVLAPDLGEAAPLLLAEVGRSVLDGWTNAMWIAGAATIVGAIGYLAWAPARVPKSSGATGAETGQRSAVDAVASASYPADPAVVRVGVVCGADVAEQLNPLKVAAVLVNEKVGETMGRTIRLVNGTNDCDALLAIAEEPDEVVEQLLDLTDRHGSSGDVHSVLFVRSNGSAPATKPSVVAAQSAGTDVIRLTDEQAIQQYARALSAHIVLD